MHATESAQALTKILRFNDDVLMVALTDMTDDIARRRLRDGGPSIAWTLGHMLHHRNQIAAAIGCRGPAFALTRYASSATDGRDYPTVRELQTTWNEFSARLVRTIDQLSCRGAGGTIADPASTRRADAARRVALCRVARNAAPRTGLAAALPPRAHAARRVSFVMMGMRVDVAAFARSEVLGLAALLTLAAVVGKQAYSLGVFGRRLDRWSIGLGMMPRGEVGLIFANIGLGLSIAREPVVDQRIFSAAVMVMLTTMATPPALKWSLARHP